MRKLVLRMLCSVDGFIADMNGDLRFGPHWSEDLQRFYAETLAAAGGLVFGRTVYQKYVPYWEKVATTGRHGNGPATDVEVSFATGVKNLPKYVASRTLTGVPGGTTLLGHDPAADLAELKRQPGGDLLLMCGPALLAALTAQDVVDAYTLDVYPIVVGRGIHLWRDLPQPSGLRLASSRRFPDDVLVNVYTPDSATR